MREKNKFDSVFGGKVVPAMEDQPAKDQPTMEEQQTGPTQQP